MALRRRSFAALLALTVWLVPQLLWAQEALSTLPLHDLSAFRSTGDNWRIVGDVETDLDRRHHVDVEAGTGVLLNLPGDGMGANLFTDWEHGDLAIELDFMMPPGSNSGVYLQGRYEVQLFDSWGVREPSFGDVGGIYQRWDESLPEGRRGFDGVPPRVNAGRAPGLWQHLEIDFRAPRFDTAGRKVENARLERVALNGTVIHENVALTGPTRAAAYDDEAAAGPLMIQGDHGPVALRHIRYKRYGTETVRLNDLTYRIYDGAFAEKPDMSTLQPVREGRLDGFRHDVVGSSETFATEFEGTLDVPTSGEYRFDVHLGWGDDDPHFQENPSGGAELTIDGRTVLTHDGLSPSASGTIDLTSGVHSLQLVTFKNVSWMGSEVRLSVEGPDTRRRLLNAEASSAAPQLHGPIYLESSIDPVVHRHMVDLDGVRRTHAVSVADPAGIHYTIDLASGALLHTWKGPFLDATPMWHARGHNQLAVPRGSIVEIAGAPPLVGDTTIVLKEYVLGADGRPTFHYVDRGVEVTDRFEPSMDGKALRRSLAASQSGLHHVIAVGTLESVDPNTFAVDDRSYLVRFESGRPRAESGRLVVPLGPEPVTYTLIW